MLFSSLYKAFIKVEGVGIVKVFTILIFINRKTLLGLRIQFARSLVAYVKDCTCNYIHAKDWLKLKGYLHRSLLASTKLASFMPRLESHWQHRLGYLWVVSTVKHITRFGKPNRIKLNLAEGKTQI